MYFLDRLFLKFLQYLGVGSLQRDISHDLKDPLFESLIVAVSSLEMRDLFSILVGCDCNEMRKVYDLIPLRHLPDELAVDFEKCDGVLAKPRLRVLNQLVKVISDQVAPFAVLHIEVNKYELVL